MKVYITKYAMTHGIIQTTATRDKENPDCVVVRNAQGARALSGNDWHESLEAAQDRAAEMKATRIRSLKKQIARLKQTTFSPTA